MIVTRAEIRYDLDGRPGTLWGFVWRTTPNAKGTLRAKFYQKFWSNVPGPRVRTVPRVLVLPIGSPGAVSFFVSPHAPAPCESISENIS